MLCCVVWIVCRLVCKCHRAQQLPITATAFNTAVAFKNAASCVVLCCDYDSRTVPLFSRMHELSLPSVVLPCRHSMPRECRQAAEPLWLQSVRRGFCYDINSRTKPHINVGTIGHVDHGKTTLTAAITKVSCHFQSCWLL